MRIFRKSLTGDSRPDEQANPSATYPLNASEACWRDEQHVRACDLVTYYTGTETDEPTLDQLDATVAAWSTDTSGDRPDVDDIDNALGIAFGEILAADTGLDWAVATGPEGSDLVLHTADDQIVLFPRAVVAAHLDADVTEPFFGRLHRDLATGVRSSTRS